MTEGTDRLYQTHLDLGAEQARQGRLAEAAVSYRNAIAVNPDHGQAHYSLGCLLERQGNLDEASSSFKRAIALDPNNVNAHNNLATLLGRQGKLDEAIVSLQKVFALNPNHGDAHCNLGNVLLQQGKLDDASTAFHRALALNPNHVLAHNNLGAVLERQGRLPEAFASLQKAIALNPNYASAHTNLARVLQKQGRFEDAIASSRRALTINPNQIQAHETLGLAYQCKGQLPEAVTHFRRAIELGTKNPGVEHALKTLSGKDAGAIPAAFVVDLFDDYASGFETHLVAALGYSAPKLMREVVGSMAGNGRRFRRALDLGCGTGLIGEQFQDIVAEIEGVDLSPKMLEQARRKNIYRELYCEEIVAWLERSARTSPAYDIVLSADVFIYVGNLEPTFKALRRVLADGGLFVFSVENLARGTFELSPTSGRFSHCASYVREVASRHGYSIECTVEIDLRKEKNVTVAGTIYLLTAPSRAAQPPES